MTNVLVLLPANDDHRARLQAAAPDANLEYVEPGEVTDAQLSHADAILGNLAPERLSACENLRLFQLASAGFDKYVDGRVPEGAALCCSSGAYGQAVSEHLFAAVLCVMKRLDGYRDMQHRHEWGNLGPVGTPRGTNVLVLGAGDIGTHVARLFHAVGASLTGVRTRASEPQPPFDTMGTLADLDRLLPEADIVCSVLPSTPDTRRLANEKFFAAMKPGSIFANAGRGDLVDQAALADALRSGHLRAATLDVANPEPLPADDPLWDVPNLLLTPHVSGFFHLSVTLDNVVDIAADNLGRLHRGEELRNRVL